MNNLIQNYKIILKELTNICKHLTTTKQIRIPEDKRWNVAFSLAAIVMVVSLVNFIFTQRRLGPIGLQPQTLNADGTFSPMAKWKEYGVYVLSLVFVPIIMTMVSITEYTDLFMYIVGPLTPIIVTGKQIGRAHV